MMVPKGNLFKLAVNQLFFEIEQGIRPLLYRKIKRKSKNELQRELIFFGLPIVNIKRDINGYYILLPFSLSEVLEYGIKIRKLLDRFSRKGNIKRVRNKNNKIVKL